MAEDRLTFPHYKQASSNYGESLATTPVKPFYYKYGGRDAVSLAMEEGGIGGKWEVINF